MNNKAEYFYKRTIHKIQMKKKKLSKSLQLLLDINSNQPWSCVFQKEKTTSFKAKQVDAIMDSSMTSNPQKGITNNVSKVKNDCTHKRIHLNRFKMDMGNTHPQSHQIKRYSMMAVTSRFHLFAFFYKFSYIVFYQCRIFVVAHRCPFYDIISKACLR